MGFSGNGYSAFATSVITSEGDLRIGNSVGAAERLAIGSSGKLLKSDGSTASWETVDTADSILAAQGDIIYADASNDGAALSAGASGYFLKTQGTSANPVWAEVTGGGISLAADNTWTGNQNFNSFISSTPTVLTISSGTIDAIRSAHQVATEGASTDTLTTISVTAGTAGELKGRILVLSSKTSSEDTTLDDGAGGYGSLELAGDFTLTNYNDTITLIGRLDDGLVWQEVCRSDNSA
jgi:hypothetical protein